MGMNSGWNYRGIHGTQTAVTSQSAQLLFAPLTTLRCLKMYMERQPCRSAKLWDSVVFKNTNHVSGNQWVAKRREPSSIGATLPKVNRVRSRWERFITLRGAHQLINSKRSGAKRYERCSTMRPRSKPLSLHLHSRTWECANRDRNQSSGILVDEPEHKLVRRYCETCELRQWENRRQAALCAAPRMNARMSVLITSA